MSNDEYSANSKQDPSNIWEMRQLNLHDIYEPAPILSRKVLNYLHVQSPFLQILNINIDYASITDKVIREFQQWNIIDNGEAISCSLGSHLFRSTFLEETEDGGSGRHGRKPFYGTLPNQSIAVTNELVRIISEEKSWDGIQFVNGTPMMKKIMLLIAQQNAIATNGFELHDSEQKRYEEVLTRHKKESRQTPSQSSSLSNE